MSTSTKVTAYVLGLIAVFGVATLAGAAIGPVDVKTGNDSHREGAMNSTQGSSGHVPGGLQISDSGYTFDIARSMATGAARPVAFRITGPRGNAVTAYDSAHEKDLHLIAVRRDLTGYQHVHPTRAPDGTWSTSLDLAPGDWRMFADFDPAGSDPALVLGADVAVGGDYRPQAVPPPSSSVEVDGYTVKVNGPLTAGHQSTLAFSFERNGRPVTDLQPYLAAYGHLVALRDGDLAYLHVHPDDVTVAGPEIMFSTTAPSAGDYRLFLDFKHGDAVHTAEFTLRASSTAAEGDVHGESGHTH